MYACDAPGNGVYHYNGTRWTNVYTYTGFGTYFVLNSIWGDASNNIFAVGGVDTIETSKYKGVVLHYDGNTWRILSIPDYRVGLSKIRKGGSKYYLSATRYESVGDTNKIYDYNGTLLREIYSGQDVATVNDVNGLPYIIYDKKIFVENNDSLVVWRDLKTLGITIGLVWGRSEKDIFAQMTQSTVYGLGHYNGNDWKIIYALSSPISDVLVFNSDIFLITANKIIVHGKLK